MQKIYVCDQDLRNFVVTTEKNLQNLLLLAELVVTSVNFLQELDYRNEGKRLA